MSDRLIKCAKCPTLVSPLVCEFRLAVCPSCWHELTADANGIIRATNSPRDAATSGGATQGTHCPHGHEFTEENIYRPPGRTDRQCRKCRHLKPAQPNG